MTAHQPTVLFVRSPGVDPESLAAWEWLRSSNRFRVLEGSFPNLIGSQSWGRGVDVLWWHGRHLPELDETSDIGEELRRYLNGGGRILLSLMPCILLGELGFEEMPPQVLASGEWEGEVGEHSFYGLMGYRGHPIFSKFYGGIYLWRPQEQEEYCEVGYPPGAFPSAGRVVGVRRVHIGIEPDWKHATEYEIGPGRILAIGAYVYFASRSNILRRHLEEFATSCLDYLSDRLPSTDPRSYWSPKTLGIVPSAIPPVSVHPLVAEPAPHDRTGIELTLDLREAAPFDLAGRRLLLLGEEGGPVWEVWAHPFRIWRNLQVQVAAADPAKAPWQDLAFDQVKVTPEAIFRGGEGGGVRVDETITVSPSAPVAALWFRVDRPARFRLSADSDFRLMWPYDPGRLGVLHHQFSESMNGFLIHDATRDFVAFLGASRPPISWQVNDMTDAESSALRVEAEFEIEPGRPLVLLVGGTNEGFEATLRGWNSSAPSPSRVFEEAVAAASSYRQKVVRFDCSDRLFAEAVEWALLKTMPFFVETPGVGAGWMAGYHTTRPGWNSGRPGYAWYFGRDTVWTSLAMLAAGDFDAVRAGLELMGDYQEFTGKIFHGLTSSGVVHYDAADSTPLFVILMARYLEWTGDIEFVRRRWERVQKALVFCFTTDGDGDGLIENSNVGHGWIEGGKLSHPHVTLELAAIWAIALESGARIAEVVNETRWVDVWRKEAQRVRRIVDNDFWDEEDNYLYYAKNRDGTFRSAHTILASIPILFGVVSLKRADKVLDELGRRGYSADWGVRMIADDEHDYDPRGYHQGSVWPLFTGWVGLAEYAGRRPTQAFAHLYGTVWNHLDGAKGCIAEVLDGDVYRPAGVCPHQAWSETMLIQPLLEGMFGLHADDLRGILRLAPQWPPHWQWVEVENLRIGERRIGFRFERSGERWDYVCRNDGPSIRVEMVLLLPPAASLDYVEIGGRRVPKEDGSTIFFELEQETTVRLSVPRFLAVVPPVFKPNRGEPSRGFRVLRERFDGRRLRITCEGRAGEVASLEFVSWGYSHLESTGGQIQGEGERRRIEFRFPEAATYARHTIELELSAD